MIGCRQVIEVGPMSGESNVIYWLKERGIEAQPELVKEIFHRAKSAPSILEEAEILEICRATSRSGSPLLGEGGADSSSEALSLERVGVRSRDVKP